jgi:hypothetical protein
MLNAIHGGDTMERKSLITSIVVLTSILLPYGVVTADTPAMTINQYWLFPLWIYLHDFGNWLGFGTIIPPFLTSFSVIPSIAGLIWCVLGIFLAMNLNQVFRGQIDAKTVWTRAVYLLVVQVLLTIGLSLIVWAIWIILVVPTPFYILFVIGVLHNQNETDNNN